MKLPEICFVGGAPFKTAEARQDVLRLVQRLVASAGIGMGPTTPSGVMLEPLTGGRSNARVFKLTLVYGADQEAQGDSVIVKIAPLKEGRQEKANYETYVRDGLPAHCRPELLGFAQSRHYSGLCYANAGGDAQATITTLTDCVKRGETKAIGVVLRRIFDPMGESWFSASQLRREKDIARHYLGRYFAEDGSVDGAQAALEAAASRYFAARHEDGRSTIGEVSFPQARRVLFESGSKRPYLSSILHGDLNTDNIVMGSGGRVSLVDFLKTGRGHVYRDLVSLEASIRINDPRPASYREILESERRIALGRRSKMSGDRTFGPIRKIRDAALGYFGHAEDGDNYQFAVAAIGLRLMRATDLSDIARARITASTLWTAKALAGERLA